MESGAPFEFANEAPLPVKKSPARYAAGLCTNHRTAPTGLSERPPDSDLDLGINMAVLPPYRRTEIPPGPRCHSTIPPGPVLIPSLYLNAQASFAPPKPALLHFFSANLRNDHEARNRPGRTDRSGRVILGDDACLRGGSSMFDRKRREFITRLTVPQQRGRKSIDCCIATAQGREAGR